MSAKKIDVDTSSFFEEASPDDAKARRLARQKEEKTKTKEPPQDGSIEAVRKRRLARLKEKEAEKAKSVVADKKTSPNQKETAPKQDSEVNQSAIAYFKSNWTVEFRGNKYVYLADDKEVFNTPTKELKE